MTMLIAKTVIHRMTKPGKPGDKLKGLKATPPETEEIQPGEVFDATDDERAEFIGNGAAVEAPKDVDKDSMRTARGRAAVAAAVKKPGPKPKAAKAEAAAAASDSGKSTPQPTGKKGETTTTGTTKSGGDGTDMV